MKKINCEKYANEILEKCVGKEGHLAVIQVGNDSRSNAYIKGKKADCKKVGTTFELFHFLENAKSEIIETVIDQLNNDDHVTGIIIQLPLPAHLNEKKLCGMISPDKDVDGFVTNSKYKPCTPEGIVYLLQEEYGDLEGTDVVIVGRGNLVGKPLYELLLAKNATVTLCHSHTKNLKDHTRRANIVVLATGKHVFGKEYFTDDQTIIDAGITVNSNGKLCGDAILDELNEYEINITPVPKGVGLLTRAVLIAHVTGTKLI